MPTPIRAEGFELQVASALSFAGVDGVGIFDAIARPAGVTIDTTVFRTGAASLKIVEDGLAVTNAQIGFAGTQVLVGSFYVRMTANPSVQSRIIRAPGPANSCKFIVETDGKINTNIQFDGTAGPVITDGAQHRIDFRFLTNATTYTIDWSVDGVAQTQHTLAGQAATNMTDLEIGSNSASHTATFWIDDLVLSATSGDHPFGAHKVLALGPTGDGTHVISGAGDFDKSDGTDILSTTTDAWTEIDAIPPNTGDYIQDTAGASTEYTEHTFADTTEVTIWAAVGQAALFSSNTTLCRLTVRVVDSGGATVADIYNNGDVSESVLHYRHVLLQTNPTQAQVNAYKARIGLSTDVAPDPRCAGILIQIAVPEAEATDLVVQDAAHTHVADASVLTQVHALAVADAGHGHTTDAVALTQVHELAANDAAHGHVAETLALMQAHELVAADALHAYVASAVVLTQVHVITLEDDVHVHTAENVVLSDAPILDVADGLHAHTADSPTLDVQIDLVLQDALHAHTVDGLVLTQLHELAIGDAFHAQATDSLVLAIPEQPYTHDEARRIWKRIPRWTYPDPVHTVDDDVKRASMFSRWLDNEL